MKEISDNELLIIRHLKRCKNNDNILKRLVGKYYALDKEYITKEYIFNCLFKICLKFDLLLHNEKDKEIHCFFICRESFGFYPETGDDFWNMWISKAKSRISCSEVKKFPRYPEPAYFRNRD